MLSTHSTSTKPDRSAQAQAAIRANLYSNILLARACALATVAVPSGPFLSVWVQFMSTYVAKEATVSREWLLVNAEGKTLGRLASKIAHRLRGKHKPEFTPHVDTGDYIVVTNASKIAVTGKKEQNKIYHRHTGYPGGIRSRTLAEMRAEKPCDIITKAVKNMLPRGPLGRQMLRKLKVYPNAEHRHQAQMPKETTEL